MARPQPDPSVKEQREAIRLANRAILDNWDLSQDKLAEVTELCFKAVRDNNEKMSIRLTAAKLILIMKGQNDDNAHKVESNRLARTRLVQEATKLAYQHGEGARLLDELTEFVSRPRGLPSNEPGEPAAADEAGHSGQPVGSLPDPPGGP